jgi:hypothetical protein
VVWRHGKVTITLAPAASFQRAGDVGQLRRDPLRRVSRQLPLTGKIVKPAARAVIEACGLFAAA